MVKKYSFLFIILAAILWSLDGLLRRGLYSLPPIIVVLYEHIIGLILLSPFLISKLPKLKKLKRKELLVFLWIATLSGIGGTLMYTKALGQINYIQFSVVVLLQQLQPLFVIVFARLVLKEHISNKYLKWVLLSLAGAYFISFPNLSVNFTTDAKQISAAFLAVGAAFAWGSSTAFSRYALQTFPVVVATGIRFGLTIPLAFIFVYLMHAQSQLVALTQAQWLSLLGIALSTGMVAMLIYYRGLKFTQAKVSAIAELAWPLSALFIGYYMFHERLTITQIFGTAALLFSMLQITKLQQHEPS